MTDINLLPDKGISSPLEAKFRKYLITLSIVLTLISAITFIPTITINQIQKNQINTTQKDNADIINRLTEQKDVAEDLRTLKEKAIGIKTIKNSQFDLSGKARYIMSIIPQNATLQNLSIMSSGKVNLGLSLNNPDQLGLLINTFSKEQNLSNVNLSGMNMDQAAKITLNVSAQLK